MHRAMDRVGQLKIEAKNALLGTDTKYPGGRCPTTALIQICSILWILIWSLPTTQMQTAERRSGGERPIDYNLMILFYSYK